MLHQSNFITYEDAPVRTELESWVKSIASLCEASSIYWCDGSQQEYDRLCNWLVEKGTFIRSRRKEDAGPTNNWMEPDEMKRKLNNLLMGSMQGRTLYVIPFCMGPLVRPIQDMEY